MISLQINGKTVELEQPTRLLAYLDQLGVNPRAVAVEHNGDIIERAAYDTVMLQAGDTVEIVRMVGGGEAEGSPRTHGEASALVGYLSGGPAVP